DRLAAQVLLVQAHVNVVALAQPIDDGRAQAKLGPQEVQPRLVDDQHHLAKQHVHVAAALGHDDVCAEHADDAQEQRHHQEAARKGDAGGDEGDHCWPSIPTRSADEYRPSRTLRTYALSAPSPPMAFSPASSDASRRSGSTSAWAFSVSISTA